MLSVFQNLLFRILIFKHQMPKNLFYFDFFRDFDLPLCMVFFEIFIYSSDDKDTILVIT
jgi:hypothetical protein